MGRTNGCSAIVRSLASWPRHAGRGAARRQRRRPRAAPAALGTGCPWPVARPSVLPCAAPSRRGVGGPSIVVSRNAHRATCMDVLVGLPRGRRPCQGLPASRQCSPAATIRAWDASSSSMTFSPRSAQVISASARAIMPLKARRFEGDNSLSVSLSGQVVSRRRRRRVAPGRGSCPAGARATYSGPRESSLKSAEKELGAGGDKRHTYRSPPSPAGARCAPAGSSCVAHPTREPIPHGPPPCGS